MHSRGLAAAASVWVAALVCSCHASHARVEQGSRPSCTGDPATEAVLDYVESVSAPAGGPIEVLLADGMTYLFDASDPASPAYAGIVESRRESGSPVYLEYYRDTKVIVDLGLPMEFRVLTITETADGVAVTLEVSAAIHALRRTQPCYDFFVEDLRTAMARGSTVWVTHNSLYEIIDVRPAS